jgi:hypothetical protein
MDFTGAYFEVANWPDFREGALTGVYGDCHKSVQSVTDKNRKAWKLLKWK